MIAITVSAGATSKKRMKPLSAQEVAQVWIGLSEDELYVLRLRLDESGDGEAAYVFGEQPPRIFKVLSWVYRDDRIEIVLGRADDSPHEVPTLMGTLIGSAMKLTMSGEGWSRRVELRREATLEGRWLRLKRVMETQDP